VVSGDFSMTARVAAVDAVDQWTKGGLMIRATSSPSSAHASIFATPSGVKGVAFQRRRQDVDASVHTAGPAWAPPVWLRLSRTGNVVTAAYRWSSSDPWTVIDSDAVALPQAVLVGFAVTSHQDGALAGAVFDDVAFGEP
jgi:hypothetical protein